MAPCTSCCRSTKDWCRWLWCRWPWCRWLWCRSCRGMGGGGHQLLSSRSHCFRAAVSPASRTPTRSTATSACSSRPASSASSSASLCAAAAARRSAAARASRSYCRQQNRGERQLKTVEGREGRWKDSEKTAKGQRKDSALPAAATRAAARPPCSSSRRLGHLRAGRAGERVTPVRL